MLQICNMVENQEPTHMTPNKAMLTYGIKKVRLFISVLIGLYVIYVVISTVNFLTDGERIIVFGSVLGATIFVFYLHLGVERKNRKKLEN